MIPMMTRRDRRELSPRAQQTLAALEQIFLRDGFRRVSVRELAARLRCSRRTLYELAPSKEDLFVRVLEVFLQRIREKGDAQAAAAPDLAARIEHYLAPGITEVARASNVFFADVAALPTAKRMLEEHQRRRIAGLRGLVTEGVRRGIFRGLDPHLVAEVFIGAYRLVSQPDFLAASKLSMTEAYAELSRLLRHGLLHSGNGGSTARGRRSKKSATPKVLSNA
jgi:AcrR family transcriptional regulator